MNISVSYPLSRSFLAASIGDASIAKQERLSKTNAI